MLRKLIKFDFKTQYWLFALLFAAAVVFPTIAFMLTPKSDTNEIQYTIRLLAQTLGPVGVIIISVIISAIFFAENFGGNGGYLLFSIPAKIRTQIASKALTFYVFFALTIFFAILCSCLCDMDFEPLTDVIDSIQGTFLTLITPGSYSADAYVSALCGMLNYLAVPLIAFSYIAAVTSFGHLFGTRKKAGAIGCVVATVIIVTVWGVFHELLTDYYFKRVWMFPEGFTMGTLYMIRDIFDTAIMFFVVYLMLRFSDWVFVKRINVL
jgi:hypothetical protein